MRGLLETKLSPVASDDIYSYVYVAMVATFFRKGRVVAVPDIYGSVLTSFFPLPVLQDPFHFLVGYRDEVAYVMMEAVHMLARSDNSSLVSH